MRLYLPLGALALSSIRIRAKLFLLLKGAATHVPRRVLYVAVGAGGDYLAYLFISSRYGGVLLYEVVPNKAEECLVILSF